MQTNVEIEYKSTGDLLPYIRNARTHTTRQIRKVAKSIQAFGFINPVIIDGTSTIVAGHARVLAAKQLRLELVPTIRVEHLSEAEIRAYILADNKLAENADWDQELLKVELEYLASIDVNVNVDLTGFEMAEIDLILGVGDPDNTSEPPTPPPPDSQHVITQPGDIWLLGSHRIVCGDCRNSEVVARLMDDNQAQMVITDPPYNVPVNGHICGKGRIQHDEFVMASGEMTSEAFTQFLSESLGELTRVSVDGSLHYVFMDWRHMSELLSTGRDVYDSLINLCVWTKTNGGMGSLYRSQHELVFVYRKGKSSHINNVELGQHGRYRTNVWSYPGVNSFGSDRDASLAMHPTVKPVRLIADAIMDVTRRGDIVLDGFLGSGTTLVAAEQTGRVCYGIEIDPRYVDVTLNRWRTETDEEPIHVDSGQTLTELELQLHPDRKEA